eukprot:TRINITY_DN10492_c0_g1_i1.p1 TRINITY_DN10492_c0_g1~~TRINITY_DN10492_c0_g1_i1.p1  ORF type:complete len:636 (+),score=148.31 TRINITY_DN10492_c0_g1_i1:25-1932(+)
MKENVRIVLIGDRRVGKTSLLVSLIKEKFEEEVPPMSAVVTVPQDATPEKVTTHIVDTSLRVQEEQDIAEQILEADVICLVYALNSETSMSRMQTYWMPFIRRTVDGNLKPVLLVGNMSDLIDMSEVKRISRLDRFITPLMNEYQECETYIECSSKTLKAVDEVFRFAQKAVLYPVAPLYHAHRHELTQKCKLALTRVFKLCDADCDQLLCDEELNGFQGAVFNETLSEDELRNVKNVIAASTEGGVADNAVTLSGFFFFNKLFIERGRFETTWAVLRAFGYTDMLDLDQEYARPKLTIAEDCVAEPTPLALTFLTRLYNRHDMDGEDALDQPQLEQLFSPSLGVPWQRDVLDFAADHDHRTSLEQFLCLWRYLCWINPSQYLETLAYLGFCMHASAQNPDTGNIKDAIQISRSRRDERAAGVSTRSLFVCRLVGRQAAGKTSLLHALAQSGSRFLLGGERGRRTAVGMVTTSRGPKCLVMEEYSIDRDQASVVSDQECAHKADVVALVYDHSDASSFEDAALLQREIVRPGPHCVFAAAKADLPSATQEAPEQPDEYCQVRHLPLPIAVSTTAGDKHPPTALFEAIAEKALHPRKLASTAPSEGSSSYLAPLAITICVIATAVVTYHFIKKRAN